MSTNTNTNTNTSTSTSTSTSTNKNKNKNKNTNTGSTSTSTSTDTIETPSPAVAPLSCKKSRHSQSAFRLGIFETSARTATPTWRVHSHRRGESCIGEPGDLVIVMVRV